MPYVVNSIAIILFAVASAVYFVRNRKIEKRTPDRISILLASIFLWATLSLLWSVDIEESAEDLSSIISYIVLPIAFFLLGKKYPLNINRILHVFAYFIAGMALFCLLAAIYRMLNGADIEVLFYHELSEQLNGMNAIYLSLLTSFAFFTMILKSKKSKVDYLLALFLFAFLFLLSSKIIVAATFFILLSILIAKRKKKISKTMKIIGVSGLLLAVISSVYIQERFQEEIERTKISEIFSTEAFGWDYEWSGADIRFLQLRAFLELAEEDQMYWKGYGFKASNKKLAEKHKEYKIYSKMIGINFHNQYLQIIAELGVVGLILLLGIFFLLLRRSLKTRDLILFSFTILVISVCITESLLWRQRGMVFFIMLSLLLYNFPNRRTEVAK
jgi:O-antigen ligase